MRNFIISTDSTADLPKEYLEKNSILVHPLYYTLEGIVYGGDNDLDIKDFYQKMRSGLMPLTMATNPNFVYEAFKKQIDSGLDILHIAFSSGLSGSCSNAVVSAKELCEENPSAKIVVVDSLSASLGEGLLVHKAVELKKQGKSIDEIADWLEKNKCHLCHQFTVDNLFHLHRGGRVSKATAIIGTLINVKPVLHVDNEGHLIPLKNVHGRKKALLSLVETMEQQCMDYENDIVFISHGDCIEDAEFVADQIKARIGIKHFLINYVSPTIGAHSGPGTVALFYMGSER